MAFGDRTTPVEPTGVKQYELVEEDLHRVDAFRRQKFASVLVVMFTDIEGYSAMVEQWGDAFALELLKEHNETLIGIIERDLAGRYIKNIGDAILAVFAEPSLAVARALEIQRVLTERNRFRKDRPAVRVRIGLHMGQVAHGDVLATDVFGSQVNRASRIQSIARGGQILMSDVTCDNARHWLQGEDYASLVWRPHGEWRLKGMSSSVVIYEVADRRYAALRRPLATKENRPVVHGVLSKGSLVTIMVAGVFILLGSLWLSDRRLYWEQQKNLEFVKTFYSPTMEAALDGELLRRVAPVHEVPDRNAAFDYLRELDLFFAEAERPRYSGESAALEVSIKIADKADVERLNLIYRRSVGRLYGARPFDVFPDAGVSKEPADSLPRNVPVLSRLMEAARSATCAFVPQIVRPPVTAQSPRLSSNRCTYLVRALVGLALCREYVGDASGADEALAAAARLAWHMGAEQYRYPDVAMSLTLQQLVAPVATVLFERRGDATRARDWYVYDLSLQLASKEMVRKRYYLSGLGRVLAGVSVQAASAVAHTDPRPFWRLEAAKELAYARALWWNRRDSGLAALALAECRENEKDPYLRRWLEVLDRDVRTFSQAVPLIEEAHEIW